MKFRPSTFLILGITMLLVTGDLSAQQQTKESGKTKETQVNETESKKQSGSSGKKAAAKEEKADCVLLGLEMKDIYGEKVKLSKYDGKVVLVVNVASKCGFTGQYKPLQDLYKEFNKHGLEVIAFPCNQFGKQEPLDEPAIDAFCKEKFGIQFAMFSKVKVKGKTQVELYKRLTQCELAPAGKGPVRWNFEKFIIGKDGKPIARFRSNVSPTNEKIVAQVKAALGIKDEAKGKKAASAKTDSSVKTEGSRGKETPKKTTPKKDNQDKKS